MSTSKDLSFTEKDMKNLALAWQCFETEPTINYKKFAEIAGYTEGSAKTTFGNLRRKVKACGGLPADANGNGSTASAPATPRKRKTANGEGNGTPKKARSTPKKKATAATESHSDDDEEFTSKHALKGEADKLIAATNEFLGHVKSEDDC